MIFNYFNMGFTLFGVNNNKKETKLDHFIYETKLAVLICPKNFTENSINPDVFYRLKKLYNIKTINIKIIRKVIRFQNMTMILMVL